MISRFVAAVAVAGVVAACMPSPPAPHARASAHGSTVGALLDEHFADPSLRGWKLDLGASTGAGPSSVAHVDSGSLLLAADSATREFLSPTRVVDVGGARLVRVSVRVRTEDVSAAGARFVNCDAFVRFGSGPITAVTPILTGTTPWTTVRRVVLVPDGSRDMTVGLFLSMPGRVWFDDLRVEPVDDEFVEQTSLHFVFRHLPGDAILPPLVQANDDAWERAAAFFGWSPAQPIVYWKYPDRATIEEYTGAADNGIVINGEVHTIWPVEAHELAHVFAARWGLPPALLAEGVGVYFSGQWQGKAITEAASELVQSGGWVTPAELIDTRSFRAKPDLVTYAVAGAFVQWIDEVRGRPVLRELYARLKAGASPRDNAAAFESVAGVSLEEAGRELLASLTPTRPRAP
ncbi:MAG: hypothetical protein ABSE49_36080 [Polyangiaceae bacterium]